MRSIQAYGLELLAALRRRRRRGSAPAPRGARPRAAGGRSGRSPGRAGPDPYHEPERIAFEPPASAPTGALAAIVELLGAEGLQTEQQVYGLEGERRVCVALTSRQLEVLLPRIESIRSGVELLQVEIQRDSETPCR